MRIKLVFAVICALALSATSAVAATPSKADRSTAQKQCAQQRTAMGERAFKDLYGTNANKSNAFGKCVSKMAKIDAQTRSSAQNECRAEQNDPNFAASHGGKTFEEYYGTGKRKNAFGKCVSSKAKAKQDAVQEATINAAKACKAERKADPEAFRKKYGTNANGRNAFGKCVSSKVRNR